MRFEAFTSPEKRKVFHGISPLKWRSRLVQTTSNLNHLKSFFFWNCIHDVYIFSLILLSEDRFSARSSVTHFLPGPEAQKSFSLTQSARLEQESYPNETNPIVFSILNIFIKDKEKHGHSLTTQNILGWRSTTEITCFDRLDHTGNLCHCYVHTVSVSREDSTEFCNARHAEMIIACWYDSLGSYSQALQRLFIKKKKKEILFLSMSVLCWLLY